MLSEEGEWKDGPLLENFEVKDCQVLKYEYDLYLIGGDGTVLLLDSSGTQWIPYNVTIEKRAWKFLPAAIMKTGNCLRATTKPAVSNLTTVTGITEKNEYPWQVGLLSSQFSSQPFCGGTLISMKDVLTAAHCTAGSTTAAYVVLGEHKLSISDGEKKVRVCGVKNHPNFTNTGDYNFAILALCETVGFTQDISPACLPSSSSNNYDNTESLVSGWGTLYGNSDVLHGMTVLTMPNSQCSGISTYYSNITDRMLCATDADVDDCPGDSGGPLVTMDSVGSHTVIGVVSWGFGCNDARGPGLYARVTNQLPWILNNMQEFPCRGMPPLTISTTTSTTTSIADNAGEEQYCLFLAKCPESSEDPKCLCCKFKKYRDDLCHEGCTASTKCNVKQSIYTL